MASVQTVSASTALGLNGPAAFFAADAIQNRSDVSTAPDDWTSKLTLLSLDADEEQDSSCPRKFYNSEWKKGDVVKAKKNSLISQQFVYSAVITKIHSGGSCDVKYIDGDERTECPRSEIFPSSFTSSVCNVEKWSKVVKQDVMNLFMVDYPLPLKRTPNHYTSSQILDFMYIGARESSEDGPMLKKLKISRVFRVHADPLPKELALMYQLLNIQVYTIPIWDMAGIAIIQHWRKALPVLHQCRSKGEQVLIHCEAGRSRSGSLGVAYFMKHGADKPLSLRESLHRVRVCRDDVYPNPTFWQSLLKFEKELTGSMSMPLAAVEDMHAYMYHYYGW